MVCSTNEKARMATAASVQVCLHLTGRVNAGITGGRCVRATAMYTPSFSTLFEFPCPESGAADTDGDAAMCDAQWRLVQSDEPRKWAANLSLPEDPGWAETYNDEISVSVTLRESAGRNAALLAGGVCSTLVLLAAVLAAKALNMRLKED
jgi:hypothetical protein